MATLTRPIRIEKRNEQTEKWEVYAEPVHAKINKNTRKKGYETLAAGAIQIRKSLIFEVRYSQPIQAIEHNTQLYRIVYNGAKYNIIDYDDYMERRQFIELAGAYY